MKFMEGTDTDTFINESGQSTVDEMYCNGKNKLVYCTTWRKPLYSIYTIFMLLT